MKNSTLTIVVSSNLLSSIIQLIEPMGATLHDHHTEGPNFILTLHFELEASRMAFESLVTSEFKNVRVDAIPHFENKY